MIIVEYYMTRKDGVILNKTYSDKSVLIERDGECYDIAIDPAELNRTYTETDLPIEFVDKEFREMIEGVL